MSKERHNSKEAKKKPVMSLKEKRAAKHAKHAKQVTESIASDIK